MYIFISLRIELIIKLKFQVKLPLAYINECNKMLLSYVGT